MSLGFNVSNDGIQMRERMVSDGKVTTVCVCVWVCGCVCVPSPVNLPIVFAEITNLVSLTYT